MRPFLVSAAALLLTTGFASAQAGPAETCLFEEEDWAATLAACNEALADSDNPVEQGRFILHRGLAHERLGDLQSALLDQILVGEYRPDWYRGYANAASLAWELDDQEARARWAQASIEAEPENANAYAELLVLQSNGDNPASCEATADRIIELLRHPVDWAFDVAIGRYLYGNLGYCLHIVDRHEEALAAYLAAETKELDEYWFHYDFASLAYYELERDDIALRMIEQAITDERADYRDAAILIGSNVFLQNFDTALAGMEEYGDMLAAADEDLGTHNLLGWQLFLEDRPEDAAPVMDAWVAWAEPRLAAGEETSGNTWDTVAHVRAALGDTEGAAEAFRLAFENYFDQDVGRALYRSELADLGFDVGEGDEALLAALDACAATGPACRLIPNADEE